MEKKNNKALSAICKLESALSRSIESVIRKAPDQNVGARRFARIWVGRACVSEAYIMRSVYTRVIQGRWPPRFWVFIWRIGLSRSHD